jgi:hypothetical protein
MKLPSTLCLAAVVGTLASCAFPDLRFYPRYGPMDLDGHIKGNAGGVSASASVDSLGIDDENVFQPRIDFDWDPMHIYAQGYKVEYEGTGTADATLDLGNGNGIMVGEDVQTHLDLELYTGSIVFDILPNFLLDLGIGAGVGVVDYDLDVQSLSGTGEASSSEDLPFGFLAARVGKTIWRFEVVALVNFLGLELDDDEVKYYDADISVGYVFNKTALDLELMLGYRLQHIEVKLNDSSDLDLDLDLAGPYLGLIVTL